MNQLRRELARVTKERDCLREAAACFAREAMEVSNDPLLPGGVSHPIDVSVLAGIAEWVLYGWAMRGPNQGADPLSVPSS